MRIKFYSAAWPELRNMEVGFFKTLKTNGATSVQDNPDIIFYEENQVTQEHALVKIFITGENNVPINPRDFDLVFTPRICSENSHVLPLWTFSVDWHDDKSDWSVVKLLNFRQDSFAEQRTRFCGFVSCKERPYRVSFVQMLSKYKPVICAGKVLNNFNLIGPGKTNKKEFLQTCKFAIAFENEGGNNYQGYVTEKIIDAFVAGAVPIYWGDPTITNVFNPKAFLNRNDYNSDQEFIEAIINVDSNSEKYLAMQREPAILNIPESFYPQKICKKIKDLFDNAPRVRFWYGTQDKNIDVTKNALDIFTDEKNIRIPANAIFNDLFGDVQPGVRKFLTVKNYYNGAVTTLPEIRNHDYVSAICQMTQPDIYMEFKKTCCKIVSGSLENWKKNDSVVSMLEHESFHNASIYLSELEDHLDLNFIKNLAKTNDLVGGASLCSFHTKKGSEILASTSSIRYVKHAFEILTLLSKKISSGSSVTIVEVGGGYGGLALTLAKMSSHFGIQIDNHIIYDLDEVTMLQKYYLEHHKTVINNVIWADWKTFGKDIASFLKQDSHVVLVSNYCMSEIDADYRKNYLQNLLPHVQSVYMRWNLSSHFDLPHNFRIHPEIPDTGAGNTIVTF